MRTERVREKWSKFSRLNFVFWESWLTLTFHSIDIHIPFPVSCLFSKIMKYILYNTQGKSKYIYFFMSQDKFYLSFIGEKVKQKKKITLFSQWKKKIESLCSWIFRGLQDPNEKYFLSKRKIFLMNLGCNVQKSQRKKEDLLYQTAISRFHI